METEARRRVRSGARLIEKPKLTTVIVVEGERLMTAVVRERANQRDSRVERRRGQRGAPDRHLVAAVRPEDDVVRAEVRLCTRNGATEIRRAAPARARDAHDSIVHAADRYAFLAGSDTLVEIDATHIRVLARGLELGCRLSWDAKKACWKIDAFKKSRILCGP